MFSRSLLAETEKCTCLFGVLLSETVSLLLFSVVVVVVVVVVVDRFYIALFSADSLRSCLM